jgi:hypothetical protein
MYILDTTCRMLKNTLQQTSVMSKEGLIESAANLKPVAESVRKEYVDKLELMVAKINSSLVNDLDSQSIIGHDNEMMMRANHQNHAKFMASIFENFNPAVLVETILWVFKAYRSHGFYPKYWELKFNAWIAVLSGELSKESSEQIIPYYIWMLENIHIFVALTDKTSEKD